MEKHKNSTKIDDSKRFHFPALGEAFESLLFFFYFSS